MPFKDKLIKEMQKCIAQFLQDTSHPSNSLVEQKHDRNKNANQKSPQSHKHCKIIKPKVRNIYQLFLRKMPQERVHVVNFFNMLTINQQALHSQDYEQSYFRTTFYLKSIKKAEFRPNCLILHLVQSNYCFTPIQYSIQRFKSLGEQKFYHLACQMEELIRKFKTIQNHVPRAFKQENNDKFDRYLHSLGNRMFVVKTASKFALSRSFLELLEYSPEEYSIEAVKFRSSLYEGCTTKNYYEVMSKQLENIKNLIDLLFDRISLQTFLDSSIVRLKDILYTKNNVYCFQRRKRIYAKVKAGMPNPYLTIYEVEEVVNISDELYLKNYFAGDKKKELTTLKQQFRSAGIKTMRSLVELPPSYLPENQHLVSHYVEKAPENSLQNLPTV